MSTINNVTAAYAASTSYTSKTTVKKDNTEVSTETAYKEDVAAVYEKSSASAGNQKVDNQALIQRMKADAEQRTSQLRFKAVGISSSFKRRTGYFSVCLVSP